MLATVGELFDEANLYARLDCQAPMKFDHADPSVVTVP
jgi:hypothetical protein